MDKQRQEEIIKALQEKGASGSCPRCSNYQFEVIGETTIMLNPKPPLFVGLPASRPPTIPVILVSCTNCGYIAQHAARPLNLTR
jgi:uncharacterized Zn finger protein